MIAATVDFEFLQEIAMYMECMNTYDLASIRLAGVETGLQLGRYEVVLKRR